MEGHAGTGRLNPDPDDVPEVTVADSAESTAGADQTDPAATTGTQSDPAMAGGPPSRLSRRWIGAICAVLVLLAGGGAVGGYFAWQDHRASQAIAADNIKAMAAARDCVAATQAPDVSALAAAQSKILQCGTGAFATQAAMYGGMLAQIYEAANVHVQVSEMRAAVERDNPDGSVDLLVALRIKVDNVAVQGQEHGYRLRVKMARDENDPDGEYKIANLDQVTK